MLTFFRRLRKSFIDSGSTRKYLLYAIGEIALVVTGILIALQINTWNTKIQNSKQEQSILAQLREEYVDNKMQLENKIFTRNEMNTACLKLLNYYDSLPKPVNNDSLDYYISRTYLRPTFDPALGVTNELLSSGRLYIIKNAELRKSLSEWTGKYYNELKEEEQVVANFILNDYCPFLIKNHQVRNSLGLVTQQNIYSLNRVKTIKPLVREKTDFTKDNIDYDLLVNPDFEDYIAMLLLYNISANDQSAGVMEIIDKILELIKVELD